MLGIDLERRQTESVYSSGSAKTAKSDYVRNRFVRLVETARFIQGDSFDNPKATLKTLSRKLLGGVAISVNEEKEEIVDLSEDEGFVIIREPETPSSKSSSRPGPHQPSYLAFRVWDNKRYTFKPSNLKSSANSPISYTPFSENGFISGQHFFWNSPLLKPYNLETVDGRNAYLLAANCHLHKQGGTSPFISVASSLVQVLNYAA